MYSYTFIIKNRKLLYSSLKRKKKKNHLNSENEFQRPSMKKTECESRMEREKTALARTHS